MYMKYTVPDWRSALTEQRNKSTGCIPWSFEWMLRLRGIRIDFAKFQENFNMQAQGRGGNHYSNIADAVMREYPDVKILWKEFPREEGMQKMIELETIVLSGKPCVNSLTTTGNNTWHIMPVVEVDDTHITMIHHLDEQHKQIGRSKVSKTDLVRIHQSYEGGNGFAWLEYP